MEKVISTNPENGVSELRALKEPHGESKTANMSQVQQFYRSLRAPGTLRTYSKAFGRVFKNDAGVEEFLRIAAEDRKAAEQVLLNWIYDSQKTLSGSSIRTFLAATKSLCDFAELPTPLNFKKIIKAAPKYSKSDDRPPTPGEIRQIFFPGDNRFKFILSLMVSSGIRVGAFNWFRMRDFKIIEVVDDSSKLNPKTLEIASIRVYAGQTEVYTTFGSSECVNLFRQYCAERERSGEVLGPNSPLVRNPVSFRKKKQEVEISKTDSLSIQSQLAYAWRKAGFLVREFKTAHGTRKYFKTVLEGAGMKSILVESLLGHLNALDSSYYRPTDDEKAKEYGKIQHVLFIDPALSLKNEKDEIIKEARSAISSESSRVQTLESKVAVLTKTIEDLSEMLLRFKRDGKI